MHRHENLSDKKVDPQVRGTYPAPWINGCDIVGKDRKSYVLMPKITIMYHYRIQEAMENFVFPDEIETKLMKMRKLMNIFYVP